MKISDDLRSPLDIKRLFNKYAEKQYLTPEDVEESWEAFKRWYVDTLEGLWKRKIETFFNRGQPTNLTLREKSLQGMLASHPEGVPLDVLRRLLRKPAHEVLAALQELEAQDKAHEVGYEVWSAK